MILVLKVATNMLDKPLLLAKLNFVTSESQNLLSSINDALTRAKTSLVALNIAI